MAEIIKDFLNGCLEIKSNPFSDHRGQFINLYREYEDTFMKSWGERKIVQMNLSITNKVGSIRGIHYQRHPSKEAKLVRCLRGKIWDVAVDMRKDSSQFGKWFAAELSPNKANALLIPEGFGHAFQILEENSEVLYFCSDKWIPDLEEGVRWNDPTLNIKWPLDLGDISEKDSNLPFVF